MTTNKPILPLFCSTPPPDDFTNQIDDEEEDEFREIETTTENFSTSQIDAQTPKISKDMEQISEGMSTFILCDDFDEENRNNKVKCSHFDESLDFRIEEIVSNPKKENDEDRISRPIENNVLAKEDFGTSQDLTEKASDTSSKINVAFDESKKFEINADTSKNSDLLQSSILPDAVQQSDSNNKSSEFDKNEKTCDCQGEVKDIKIEGDVDIEELENLSIIRKAHKSEGKSEEFQDNFKFDDFKSPRDNSSTDDFDDFESFPVSNNTSEFQSVVMEPQAACFEADFSQFSAFEEFKNTTTQAEFDEDFDDFQEFASAPILQTQSIEHYPQIDSESSNVGERISAVLESIFPKTLEPVTENCLDVASNLLKNPKFIKQIDSSLALTFQWNSSDARKTLVKSVGVDCTYISFQDNWNPSMPRFAANLRTAPLEPLKATTSEIVQAKCKNTQEFEEAIKPAIVEKVKIPEIPSVEFDWNYTNSVGPLDGSQENNQTKIEELHSSQLGKFYDEYIEQPLQITDVQIPLEFGASIPNSISETASTVTVKQQVVTEPSVNIDFGLTNTSQPENPAAATSTTYSGTFKETHIFTPPKSEAIARLRTKSKSPIDFDFETAAAGIIIDEKVINKEYRDVEYKPPTPPPKVPPVNPVLPIEDEFSEFQSVSMAQQRIPVPVSFQKIKETESRTSTPNSLAESEMILSPAVLLPQTIHIESEHSCKPKVEWPEPGINPDEMARFELLFSKDKPSEENIDEDDWSDFVSNTEFIPKATTSTNTYQEDEWSDFVSSVPPQPQFNSAAWQNANFYNNPLSVYASTHSNFVPNENNNNISMVMANPSNNFNNIQTPHQTGNLNKNQFLNYNKVAPSISLIPDLGFVAPPNVSSGRFLNNFQNTNFPRK